MTENRARTEDSAGDRKEHRGRDFARTPAVVATFLASLIAVQGLAMLGQFRHGFRPFQVPPGRVAFSWDMFAVAIERCGIEWQPALPIGYRSLHQMGTALEWDPVYDLRSHYFEAALLGCQLRKAPTRVQLACMTAYGLERHVFDCP